MATAGPVSNGHGAQGGYTDAVSMNETGQPLHPFFDERKRRELRQQSKQPAKSKRKATEPPNAPPADDDDDYTETKPKPRKPRKSRAKAASSAKSTRPRESTPPRSLPPPDLPPPSSALQSVASTRTEIDPITAAAGPALSPAPPSSPPQPRKLQDSEAEAPVDPNSNRRKRRKTSSTPSPPRSHSPHLPLVFIRGELDEDVGIVNNTPSTGRSTRSSAARNKAPAGDGSAGSTPTKMLVICANGKKIKREDLLPKPKKSPSAPPLSSLPPSSPGFERQSDPISSVPSTPNRSMAKLSGPALCVPLSSSPTPTSPLCPLSIRTSPRRKVPSVSVKAEVSEKATPPGTNARQSEPQEDVKQGASETAPAIEQPPLVNAFTLLGKKKPEKKETTKVKKEPEEEVHSAELNTDQSSTTNAFDLLGKKRRPNKANQDGTFQVSSALPGSVSAAAAKTEDAEKPPASKSTADASKKMHPFFNSEARKQMAKAATTSEGTDAGASTTPSTASQSPSSKGTSDSTKTRAKPWPAFGFSSKIAKVPGLKDAPWSVSHVRDLPPAEEQRQAPISWAQKSPKSKDKEVVVGAGEHILERLSAQLGINEVRDDIRKRDYAERQYNYIGPEVRKPKRTAITSTHLQEMVRHQVSARLPHPAAERTPSLGADSDELDTRAERRKVHPALVKLYYRISDELSAFDKYECEAMQWEAKYAPTSSAEVLQPGREIEVLKKWLVGLKTDKVDAPADADGRKKRKAKGAKSKADGAKKRKKKKKKDKDDGLGGFIVTSDEERNMMDEITDPEDESDWLRSSPRSKRSILRAGDKESDFDFGLGRDKKTNTVVISGPTGCGKTAAVYAVAQELGYTVFEISPGTRRSGKDVVDLVGEMSKNHLVHQSKTNRASNPFERSRLLQETSETDADTSARQQQQCLILLDEVDVLFEEDKNFWSAVVTLMSNSKRPIVLTCNDESLLPFETLSLHAVLRFSRPPRDLAVDYLLLICANEGHLLQRDSVENLVKANRNDIRASLMQLQFYCRIGVGSRQAIIDWLPKSEEKNNAERVVSEDTYLIGMGWMDNFPIEEERRWQDAWEQWGVDMAASNEGLDEWAGRIDAEGAGKAALGYMQEYLEARSAADAFGGCAMRGDDPILDPSLPKRSQKSKVDDPQGYGVLQADPHFAPGSLTTEISIHVRSQARANLASTTHTFAPLSPISNDHLISAIVHRRDQSFLSAQEYQALFAPLSRLETMFASTPAPAHSSVYPSLQPLAAEVAPFVRAVLRTDVKRERERRRVGTLLSLGGTGRKRKTRAARLALEGGDRGKRERYFRTLGVEVLEKSAGKEWAAAEEEGSASGSSVTTASSPVDSTKDGS